MRRKLNFNVSVIQKLKDLEELLRDINLDGSEMGEVFAGDGCGGVCRYSCSNYCHEEPGCDSVCWGYNSKVCDPKQGANPSMPDLDPPEV